MKTKPWQLRPYQQEAVDATVAHFKQSNEAAVIVLPTGAGKSLVIAELARIARQKILVLAHVKELVEQNAAKYKAIGAPASIFSAGLNEKQTEEQIVFGSVQSVARNLAKFAQNFSLLIIDECHRLAQDESSQYQQVIDTLKISNPELKVLGLTATPYRLDSGWIYQQHLGEDLWRSDAATPFRFCIYELPLRYMINKGYLTPVELLDAPVALYDFEQLRPKTSGLFSSSELNQVVSKSKRATARIIEQVVAITEKRHGVMIFSATVEHAKEVLSYLPSDRSAIVLGDMKVKARDSVIRAFKQQQIKYLVNVSVLTTGFDAPHVDTIVLLRPTESVSLYQQIIGRGLRLSPNKENCLVLDYAGNDHRLFSPEIGQAKPDSDSDIVQVNCPACGFNNHFWGKLDEQGNLLEHYGRRCQSLIDYQTTAVENQLNTGNPPPRPEKDQSLVKPQLKKRCEFRFRFKECPSCGQENDIAARKCSHCDLLLVDPDEKLKQALALRDHIVLRCAGFSMEETERNGKKRLEITYHDEDGTSLKEMYYFETSKQRYACWHYFLKTHRMLQEQFPKDQIDQLSSSHIIQQGTQLRTPDFVIARQEKNRKTKQIRTVIIDKLFDYEGRYRRANEL